MTPTEDPARPDPAEEGASEAVRGPNDGVPAAALATLPGPLPQALVDAADPDVHPGRPADRLHGGRGDGRPLAEADRLAFWEAAGRRLSWERPFTRTHSLTAPDPAAERGPEIRWYEDGTLNVAVNCVDRHVAAGRGEKVALYFEGEPGDRRAVTYAQLQREVAQAANALEELGIEAGDRVVVYLPVLVETIVITLACARIGAVHSLVFGGFSAEALPRCGAVGRNWSNFSNQVWSAARIAVMGAVRVCGWLPGIMWETRRSRAGPCGTQTMRRGWELNAVGPILVRS